MTKKYFSMRDIRFAIDMARERSYPRGYKTVIWHMRKHFDPEEFSSDDIRKIALDTAGMSVEDILKTLESLRIAKDITTDNNLEELL